MSGAGHACLFPSLPTWQNRKSTSMCSSHSYKQSKICTHTHTKLAVKTSEAGRLWRVRSRKVTGAECVNVRWCCCRWGVGVARAESHSSVTSGQHGTGWPETDLNTGFSFFLFLFFPPCELSSTFFFSLCFCLSLTDSWVGFTPFTSV